MQKGTRGSLFSSAEAVPGLVAGTATAVAAATGTVTAATVAAATGTATAAVAAATGAVTAATKAAATGASATTVAATAAAEAAGTWRTWLHRTCFVHHETAATELLTVHCVDSGLCFSIAAHFHKAETLGATCVAFHHDFGAGNRTVCCKCLLQVFVTERIRQVAHVKFVAHGGTPQNNSKRDGVLNRNQQTIEDLEQTRN